VEVEAAAAAAAAAKYKQEKRKKARKVENLCLSVSAVRIIEFLREEIVCLPCSPPEISYENIAGRRRR
jgi:hypothetical protein